MPGLQKPKRIVCFLARPWGLRCLESLLSDPSFTVVQLFTHRLRPKSEDPSREERPEFVEFKHLALARNIPLEIVDSKKENERLEGVRLPAFDFVLSCSWRYMLPMNLINQAEIGSVNLHRGKLPEYKGAEPIRRMLEDNRGYVTLTAHEMVAGIDEGRVICEATIPAKLAAGETILVATERLKKELEPSYPLLMRKAFQKLEGERYANLHHR